MVIFLIRDKRALLIQIAAIFFFLTVIFSLMKYSHIKIKPDSDQIDAGTDIVINFLLPMHCEDLTSKVSIIPEIPYTQVDFETKWLNSTTVVLSLKEIGYPQGQLIKYHIDDIPTIFPYVKKGVTGQVRPKAPLKVISDINLNNIPSKGPVPIYFSTPVKPETLKKHISVPVPGQLIPQRFLFGAKKHTDYSKWEYIPEKPFSNGLSYQVILKPGIRSIGGSILNNQQEINYITTIQPKVVSTVPSNGNKSVQLYRTIAITLDQETISASIKVTDIQRDNEVSGKTKIAGNKIIFQPDYAFLPGSNYKVKLQAISKNNEPMDEYEFSFITLDMGAKYWVDVKLAEKHTVSVYKGNILIKHMPASGGKCQTPTPLGYFYTKDRGYSFYSPRFGEGATYWVRLVGQVLVHSVPRDSRWKIKKEEHEKLGLPASHGCIRLSEEDAKWFYQNIPRNTLIIVHQ